MMMMMMINNSISILFVVIMDSSLYSLSVSAIDLLVAKYNDVPKDLQDKNAPLKDVGQCD